MSAPAIPAGLEGLVPGVVHRLGAAAAFVASPADAQGAAAEPSLLGLVLGTLGSAVEAVLASGTARYLPLPRVGGAAPSPEAAVAVVPVACAGGEPLGCLVALRPSGWSRPERIALECMAECAAASAARQREADARAEAERRVRMLEGALQTVDLGVTIADERGRIVYANPAEARMHGYELEEMFGLEARSLAPPELWSPAPGIPPRRTARWARERTNVRRDGTRFPVRLCSDAIEDDGAPLGLVTWCEDLTAREHVDALHRSTQPVSDRDPLTGTLGREAFLRRLRLAFDARDRLDEQEFSLLFIDLDRFKAVNDRYGHAAGDALLAAVGHRLVACVRPTDAVGRVGGDEFAVLLTGTGREAEAVLVVRRIQRALAAPVVVGTSEMRASASIGIALGSECEAVEDLLASADRAMYRAKALGPGHYGAADAALETHDSAVGDLEADLRRAIENDELTLRFQPIVFLADRRLAGFEALVRWNHPERGLLGPQAFLPVAERSDLIVQIDRWVLRAAARQLRDWPLPPGAAHPPCMSVNFSGRHVVCPDVVEHTRDVLREFGLEPGQLTVEITETSMVEDAEAAASSLARLRKHGVRLALDDFGTGYSSLSYLRQLPFDVLKIDRSFVQRIAHSESDRAIVRSVIALAHSLGLSVTAEGIETLEQEGLLRGLGCEQAQGYLFAGPASAADAAGWIERGAGRA